MLERQQEAERLRQEGRLRYIREDLGRPLWVTVYRCDSVLQQSSVCFFSALIPNAKVKTLIQKEDWDFHFDSGMPGCIQYGGGEDAPVRYLRFGNDEGIEPLVFRRYFHGIKEAYFEVSEEFRHFHRLYFDSRTGKHIKVLGTGEEKEIIVLEGDCLKIRLQEIREFLAIKEMHLAIFFEIRENSMRTMQELGLSETREAQCFSDLIYSLSIGEMRGSTSGTKAFSRLFGKKLIPGCAKEDSNFWPYEKREKRYAEFIIGVDDNGNEIVHTSAPAYLADGFGGNRGAPSYLTPVFFRKNVLSKYYANPGKYSVRDGYLSCGGLWGTYIDNNHPDYVVVWLGDLGRDLHYEEQLYWRSFNVAPEGPPSEVFVRRQIMAQFTDPSRPDLLFKHRLGRFSERCCRVLGWDLFLPLHEGDSHLITALHVPTTDDTAEFDRMVLALAKVLVDSLNEDKISKAIGVEAAAGLKGGILKMERFLKLRGLQGFDEHVKFLRNLQKLRSTSVAHRKGRNFQQVARTLGIGQQPLPKVFEDILRKSLGLLDYLECTLLAAPQE